MRRRGWWPLAFAVSTLTESAPSAAWPKGPMWTKPAPRPALNPNPQSLRAVESKGGAEGVTEPAEGDHSPQRPLSWDREDEALAAQPAECPWCPDLDFPDAWTLLRHVTRHARAWEAEAIHAERLRRSLEGQVREFTSDVRVMAAGILGETP